MRSSASRLIRRGISTLRQGDAAAAERILTQALQLDEDQADAWHYRGLAAAERGDRQLALEALARAETLAPDNSEFLVNHARVLLSARRYEDALVRIDRARACTPPSARILAQAAMALIAADLPDEAIPLLEEALPALGGTTRFRFLMLLSRACAEAGYRHKAEEAAAEACRLMPSEPTVSLELLECMRILERPLAERRTVLLRALRTNRTSHQIVQSLAQECAARGRFAAALRLARRALRLAGGRDYLAWLMLAELTPPAETDSLLEELRAAPQPATADPTAHCLWFATGRTLERLGRFDESFTAYARGNTEAARRLPYEAERYEAWLESVLRCMNRAFIEAMQAALDRSCDESPIFICGMPRSGTTLVERILSSASGVRAGGELKLIWDALRRRFGGLGYHSLGDSLRELPPQALTEFSRALHADYRERRRDARTITDKMPTNFELLGLIWAIFPRANIIHVRRDPLDTCFSCFATPFDEANAFSYSLEGLARHYNAYRRAIAHWKEVIPSERILDVDYERLVTDPRTESRRITEFCDFPWSPALLAEPDPDYQIATASQYQVRQPISTASIGRAQRFAEHLEPLVAALGAGPAVRR